MKIQTKWVCKIFFQVLKIDNKRKRKKVFTSFFFQMNFYWTMSYKCKNTKHRLFITLFIIFNVLCFEKSSFIKTVILNYIKPMNTLA